MTDPKHCEDCGAMEQRGVYCATCIPCFPPIPCDTGWRDMLPPCLRYGCTGVLVCGYCNQCCNVDDLPEDS